MRSFYTVSLFLSAFVAAVAAVPGPRLPPPPTLVRLLRSARKNRNFKPSLSFDRAGLELTPKLTSQAGPRPVRRVLRSGADVVNAILRADRNRLLALRRSTSSSPRFRRFAALLRDYSSATTFVDQQPKVSSPLSRTPTKPSPEPTYESLDRSPFDEEVEVMMDGLTGDSCYTVKNCKGNRVCVGQSGACRGRDGCHCIPPVPVPCSTSSDCVPGEMCMQSKHLPGDYCVSEKFSQDRVAAPEESAAPSSEYIVEAPAPSDESGEGGLTADPCEVTDDCYGERTCLSIDTLTECQVSGDCVCFPPTARHCSDTDQCPAGEACASSVDADDICLSVQFVASNPDVVEAGPVASHEYDLLSSPGVEVPTSKSSGQEPDLEGIPGETDMYLFPRGLTGDSCNTDKDCRANRSCVNVLQSCSMDDGCICSPRRLKACTESLDCADGEVCVSTLNDMFCISEVVMKRSGLGKRVIEVAASPSFLPEERIAT